MKYILKPAITLFLTAAISITLLSVVHSLTLEPIEAQKKRTQEAALKEVLPQASDYRPYSYSGTGGSITAVYEGIINGVLTGYVLQLSPQGYSGSIDLMVGISIPDNKISGVRVLRHTETPGLGALAVKEEFYRQYDNKQISPLRVVKTTPGAQDINAITSATITTRAITDAVNEAVEWYRGGRK